VDQIFFDLLAIEDLAAWAFHVDAARLARRQIRAAAVRGVDKSAGESCAIGRRLDPSRMIRR